MGRNGAGLHTLVGAYVMDAVPAADRAAFERHLISCDQCRAEVQGLREATARLAAAAAIEPRTELREQTLQAAERLRQLPPVVAEQRQASLANRMARWTRRAVLPGRLGQSWIARLAVVAAVVFASAAVGFGLHASSMQHRLSVDEQRDHQIAAILGAADATTLTAKVSTGGIATVVMSHHARKLVFIAHKLSVLPASRAYELWLMGPSGDTSAGMLPSARGGMTGPMVVGGLAPGDQLGLTIEPAAGSPQPTSAPIVLVGLGI